MNLVERSKENLAVILMGLFAIIAILAVTSYFSSQMETIKEKVNELETQQVQLADEIIKTREYINAATEGINTLQKNQYFLRNGIDDLFCDNDLQDTQLRASIVEFISKNDLNFGDFPDVIIKQREDLLKKQGCWDANKSIDWKDVKIGGG